MSDEVRSGTVCPHCGDPVPPGAADRGAGDRRERALCDACYRERHDLVQAPEGVTLTLCSTCGAVRRDGEWADVGDRDYTDLAVEAVQERLGVHAEARDVTWAVDPEQVDATTLSLTCEFTGRFRGEFVEESVTVPVSLPRGTCSRCGRIAGGDHAAVLQLRAMGERTPTAAEVDRAVETASDYVETRAAGGDRDAFVAEVEETPDGVDVQLSTTSVGRGVAERVRRQLGGRVSHASTLVTEDEEGDPVYRVTSLVRLPPFRQGDVVDPGDGDGPVLVRSVDGSVKGRRTLTGEPFDAPYDADVTTDATRLGHRSAATETTLVAIEDERAVQVLDPETYETRSVARPIGLDGETETVRVLRGERREDLHVVPPAGALEG
ncbi:MAG: 60S ribosomal export protein NMD3 [Halobacteriaceae archaeon]